MIKIFEKNQPIKNALERSLPIFLGEDADVLITNVDQLNNIRGEVEKGTPVIFYGCSSEESLRLKGDPAVPYFYRKNTGYYQLPFNLSDIAITYKSILDGKKIENRAAILASQTEAKRTLAGILLHDLHPGKNTTEPMKKAQNEFDIAGSTEKVREKLKEIMSRKDEATPVKDLIGDEVLKGVFCDIEGTLLSSDGAVNESVLQMLEKEEGKRAVSIWTGGDTEKLQKKLYQLGVKKFPILSKYSFKGCEVEVVIDDLSQDEFKKRYGIKSQKYIQI